MTLTERGRGIIRRTLLASALLLPLEACTQPETSTQNINSQNQEKAAVVFSATAFAPKADQLSSPAQKTETELPYTADSSKWIVAASYTSDFTGSERYRRNNIIAGANALNNEFWDFGQIDQKLVKFGKNVIKPGETFSINSVLGEVTNYEMGYAIGSDLKPVEIYGGGICQIPTTMFVASLQNGLSVEERTNHAYVYSWALGDPNDSKEMGKDATVYMSGSDTIPSLDLVVRNTYEYPIRFFLQVVEGQHLRAEIYGPPELKPYHVEIEGPTMVYPFKGRLVKDIGRYTGAAKTIVRQSVWKDPSKQEEIFVDKKFESVYQAFPHG